MKRKRKDGLGHADLSLNVPLQDFVEGLDLEPDQALGLCLALDLRQESVEFTEDLIRALVESLRKDYGKDWDPRSILQ